MKKLYLLLVAMIVSLTVSATDYYLIGGINGWTLKDANYKFTPGDNGVYTLDVAKLTSGFKINDGTWNNDNLNFGGNGTLKEGTVFNLVTAGNSGNINMEKDIENAHLEFNPTAKTLLITGRSVTAVYTYQIWGEVKTGVTDDWQGIALTEEEDGVWVYSGALKPGHFGIRQMNGVTQTKWYSAASSASIGEAQLGKALPVQVEGTNWNSSLNGNYKFVFNVNALTLTITELGDDPVPPTPVQAPNQLYIIGDLSNGSWNTTNAPAMTKDGNVFSIENIRITNGSGTGYFSFITATGANWDVVNSYDRYGALTGDAPVTLDEPIDFIKYEVGVNASSAKSWKIAEGTYDFTVDFDTMKLTVTESGGDPIPVDYTYDIWGNIVTGEWSDIHMTKEDNVWTATADVVPGNFGIRKLDGDNQVGWLSAPQGNATIGEEQLDMALAVAGSDNENFYFTLEGNFTFTFDSEALTLTIHRNGEVVPPTPDVITYDIWGGVDGGEWSAIEMTEEETGVWTATADCEAFNFGIRKLNKGSQIDWISAPVGKSTIGEEQLGQTLELASSDNENFNFTLTGNFTFKADMNAMTLVVTKNGGDEPNPDVPEKLYIIGNLSVGQWDTTNAPEMTKDGNVFFIDDVEITNTGGGCYFSFITSRGADWDEVNAHDRYGATSENERLPLLETVPFVKFAANDNAASAYSWQVPAGPYSIAVDFDEMVMIAIPKYDPQPDVITFDIWGGISGGDWSAITMTEESDGIWTATADCSAFEFGIRKLNNGDQEGWYSAPKGQATIGQAQLGQAMQLVDSENENFKFTLTGNFTFKLDSKAMTLTIIKNGDEPEPEAPEVLYLVGNLSTGSWNTSNAPALTKNENVFTINDVNFVAADGTDSAYFSFITVTGSDWDSEVNTGDRYGAEYADAPIESEVPATLVKYPAGVSASSAASWKVAPGTYNITVDFNNMTVTVIKTGDEPEPEPVVPDVLYLVGNLSTGSWNTSNAPALTKDDNVFTINDVEFVAADGTDSAYFSFITVTGSDWDSEVNTGDRYGAESADAPIESGVAATLVRYRAGVNASSAASWKIAPGTYNITVNFNDMTVTVDKKTVSITALGEENADVEYFDINGIRVLNPAGGQFYIVRRGEKISKEFIR